MNIRKVKLQKKANRKIRQEKRENGNDVRQSKQKHNQDKNSKSNKSIDTSMEKSVTDGQPTLIRATDVPKTCPENFTPDSDVILPFYNFPETIQDEYGDHSCADVSWQSLVNLPKNFYVIVSHTEVFTVFDHVLLFAKL